MYLLCQHNKISKKVNNNLISHYKNGRKYNNIGKYDCYKRSQSFCFNFEWPKDVAENLKYEIEFIIASNESLAENKMKKRD